VDANVLSFDTDKIMIL